jgi:CheY-like chemotaxis protein
LESSVETMLDYVKTGRIKVDKSKNDTSYTYHDSCNFARSCGMTEEPRELLNLVVPDFREMYPNRAENFCCTGGGGAMSMSEYTPDRLKSAKVKADQLKATGAKVVVTSCHNCVDGLNDVIRHYKLDMEVTQLVNLVATALVIEDRVAEAPAEGSALAGRTILVVDDEADARKFITMVLADNGATVLEAENGDEALKIMREKKPDLVTLDLSMPGKDGGEVYEEIRKDAELKSSLVCIVTGKPELRRLIYDKDVAKPEGYLDKPLEEDVLLTNVRRILEVADKD